MLGKIYMQRPFVGKTKLLNVKQSKMLLAILHEMMEIPRWHSSKEFARQCWSHKRCRFDPWVGKIPWKRKMATHCSIVTWEIPWIEESRWLQSTGS